MSLLVIPTPPPTSPGGSSGQVQYYGGSGFAGSPNLTFDGTNLTVGGIIRTDAKVALGNVTPSFPVWLFQGAYGGLAVHRFDDSTFSTLEALNLVVYSAATDSIYSRGGMYLTAEIFLTNQSTPSTPTGGGRLFCNGGALKYVGSSGTVTTLAPA